MTDNDRTRVATRLYRLLMRLYPRQRRREDGEEMEEMFSDIYEYEPESHGAAGRARLAHRTLRDVLGGAVTERLPFFDMLRQDLRYGLRRLREAPTLSVAAVVTLAVGIGAVTSIYSFVDALVLHPLAYPDVDRVVAIGEVTPRRGLYGEGWVHGAEFRQLQQLESLGSVSAMSLFLVTMTGAGDPAEVIGWRATPAFFSVAGVRPLIGRGFGDSAADADTVVLGHAFWQSRFDGDDDVVGRTLRLAGRPMTVIGVMPPGAEFPMGADLWVPLQLTPEQAASYGNGSSGVGVRTIARLAPGATIERLRAELAPIAVTAAEAAPETHENTRFDVEPILANMTVNTRSALGFLMGAAGFLLLLVCGNVANMQLAQAAARRQEMAMRQALGAPRGRLIRQLLTESMALAALAAVAGTLLAIWSASGLRAALGHERWRFFFAGVENVGVNPSVLTCAAAVSLGSVILFGLVPALRCSRVDINEALKQSLGGGGRGGNKLRRSLVALEVALSAVLLVGAGLMASSIGAFARFEPGVDADVLTVRLRLPQTGYEDAALRQQFFDAALAEAAALPGVAAAALAGRIPATSTSNGVAIETDPAGAGGDSGDSGPSVRVERHDVAGDYFETLGIPMLTGRGFAAQDLDVLDSAAPAVAPTAESGTSMAGDTGRSETGMASTSVVVSAALAERLWPGESALGQRLRFGEDQPWLRVTGVAANVARSWSDPRPSLSVYVPDVARRGRTTHLLLDARGNSGGIMQPLRERIWALDDAVVVFAPETIDASIDAVASPVRSMNRLVAGMAIAALIVCLSGVYALVAHAIGQRRREIGVRLALGARDRQVVRMLVAHGLKTTGLGLVIGLALAFGLASALAGFLAGMLTVDGRVFVALAAGMLLLAALSSWLPARRVARIDPASTLRAD